MVMRSSRPEVACGAQAPFRWSKLRGDRTGLREQGALTTELVVSMAILAFTLIPLSFAFMQEVKVCRLYYYEAVAMEVVDGEMEVLAAGEWRAFSEGQHNYTVRAEAAKNLPAGRFLLSRADKVVRLEWRPDKPGSGRPVSREWRIK